MNAQVPQLDDPERPRAATIKFTYPSGARPLEGYTIKRGVGRGGFGEVYFATSDAGKEVALKLIRRNLDVELRGVTQCLNLKHPNLISLYDIRTDEHGRPMGRHGIRFRRIARRSDRQQPQRHCPSIRCLSWMRGICAGVAYLHDHGIVHRDLKPGNIFSDEGTVKIGDYGLAKFISCSRRSGQTESVGTVHYMAPEIANGRYGREIDTYALGIILFEMLTGHVPFEGESVGEVLMKHLTAEPDLTVLQEPYRDIVKRALAKDPSVRIKSVGELVALLPGGSEATPTYARVDAQPKPQPTPPPKQNAASPPPPQSPFDAVFNFGAQYRTHLAAHSAVEEPVAKAARTAWRSVSQRWRGEGAQPLSRLQKIGLVVAVFLLVQSSLGYTRIAPFGLAVQCLFVYGIYYAFWATFFRPKIRRHTGEAGLTAGAPPANTPQSQRAAEQHTAVWAPSNNPSEINAQRADQAQRRRRSRTNWRDRVNQQLATKPLREKLTELLGSMLLAAIFAAVASCAVPLLLSTSLNGSELLAMYLWVMIVGTLGSWAILVPSKFVEGKLEDHVPLRITLMLLGALLGLAAWFVADSFMLHFPGWREPIDVGSGLVSHQMLGWPKNSSGPNPALPIYVAYFAFLLLLPRWWRQTEYTRGTRMSLWCTLTCVFTAWLLHIFWWFPQPTGMIVAGVIALTTQLASPWMPPSQRRAISESAEQAVT